MQESEGKFLTSSELGNQTFVITGNGVKIPQASLIAVTTELLEAERLTVVTSRRNERVITSMYCSIPRTPEVVTQ